MNEVLAASLTRLAPGAERKGLQVRARRGYYAPSDTKNAFTPKPGATDPAIQAAVDAAQPGDRIVVQPGRYLYFTVTGKNARPGATEMDRIVIEADAAAPRDSVEVLGGPGPEFR